MSNATLRIPSYRRHKPTGQAVVTIGGRDLYLGKYNSAASRAEYNRIVAEWMGNGATLPPKQAHDFTVAELLAAFVKHAKSYYRGPDGKPTHEVNTYNAVLRRMKTLYGRTPASAFGPLALKAVRQTMIGEGLARQTINQHTNRIRHVFRWAVENQLIEAPVLQALQAVSGLRFGRSDAKETEPVRPVPDAFVDAVLPYIAPQVAAMIELQRITGMRSGEVTIMRGGDINMAGSVWVYTPETHKTAYRGHQRQIYLGPKAQEIIRSFLKADLQAYLFSSTEAYHNRIASWFLHSRPGRRTKIYPSELRARKRRSEARRGRRKAAQRGDRYTTESYLRAIKYGIKQVNKERIAEAQEQGIDPGQVDLVPDWHPHQLRHNAATNLRREHGIEIARIILGHRSAAITEVYAEVDHARAIDVMAKIG